MDIFELAETVDRHVDAIYEFFADIFWYVFLFIQTLIFEPLLHIGGSAWLYASASLIALWLAMLRFSRLLPGEKAWQLLIMRTLLAKFLLYTIPTAMLAWFFCAYAFSGNRLDANFFSVLVDYLDQIEGKLKKGFIWGVIAGLLLIFVIGRYIEPAIDRWLNRKTKRSSNNRKLNDVREVKNDLPRPVDFDPCQFFEMARKLNALFFGKDANNKCIFIPRSEWNNSNILLLGPTRRGKGVQAAMVLLQCLFIDQPDIIIVIDPKLDDFGPLVLRDGCKKASLPFIYVNARRGLPPQFNLLFGASKDELITILVAGYDLHPKNTSDDFYRRQEQEALELLIQHCSDNPTIREIYELSIKLFSNDEMDNIQNLITMLRQDAQIQSINSKSGPSLDLLLERGGVFWFVGSEDDPSIVRIQRMFAYRAVQWLRNRNDKSRHATVFADELKFLVSGPFYKSFGTILGSGNANIIAAIQSTKDLTDIPQSLNPEAVSQVVFDNCNLKWIYRTHHPETVDWVVAMEGTKVVSRERLKVERNMQLAETTSSERSLAEEEVSFLHRNHVLHLPNRCAIMIGFGIAKFAYTSPVKVEFEVIQPTHVQSRKLDSVIDNEDPFL